MSKKFVSISSILLVLLAVISTGSVTVNAQTRKERQQALQLVNQADKFFKQKDYRAAADAYAQSIRLVPNNGYAHFWKGYAHYNLKENDAALSEFAIALSQGFKPIQVYTVRWYVYYDQKDYDSAIADIQRGLALEPRNLIFLKALGELYLAKNQLEDALRAYQQAVLVAPKDGDLYYSIARVQFGLGNTAAQAAAADEAIKKNTQLLGDAYFLLGDAQQKQKKNVDAIAAYQRAIAAKPLSYQAYRNLAEIFRSESRYNEAIEIEKRALLLYPNDGYIYTDISWYYSLADRHEEAIQAAQSAIKILPQEYMAYTNLCRAYNDTKQYPLAINACNSALKINPKDGETYFYLARAYDLSGRTAEATRNYSLAVKGLAEAAKADPTNSDTLYLLGNAYFSDNQRDRAIEAYNKCLELNPRFAKARLNLGRTLVLKKDKAGALVQYNELLKIDQKRAAQLKSDIDKL